jgi:hypothetical protein
LTILKGVHKTGIHLLAFSKNDTFVVSCGLNLPSAVVIYDWKNNLVLVSSNINSTTQDIFTLPDLYIDSEIQGKKIEEMQGVKEEIKLDEEDEYEIRAKKVNI